MATYLQIIIGLQYVSIAWQLPNKNSVALNMLLKKINFKYFLCNSKLFLISWTTENEITIATMRVFSVGIILIFSKQIFHNSAADMSFLTSYYQYLFQLLRVNNSDPPILPPHKNNCLFLCTKSATFAQISGILPSN